MSDTRGPRLCDRSPGHRRYWAALAVATLGGICNYALLADLDRRFVSGVPPEDKERLKADFRAALTRHRIEAGRSQQSIEQVLHGVVGGRHRAAALVEATPDGLQVAVVLHDARSATWLSSVRMDHFVWDEIWPLSFADPDERLMSLAGAPSAVGLSWQDLASALRQNLRTLVASRRPPVDWLDPGACRILQVRRNCGWKMHYALMHALSSGVGSSESVALEPGDSRTLQDLIERVTMDTPLQARYGLLVAEVDSLDCTVRPSVHPLFEPGQRRSTARPREVWVGGPEVCPPTVYLAVVSMPEGTLQGADLVHADTIRLAPHSRRRLILHLESPRLVRIECDQQDLRPTRVQTTLADILDQVPSRIDPNVSASLDLACLVELAGSDAALQERLTLLRDVVPTLQVSYPAPDGLRLAVIGYGDRIHILRAQGAAPKHQSPITRLSFAEPDTTLAQLGRLRPFDDEWQDFPVALEEALEAAMGLPWRSTSRHALLTIGSRPPHPAPRPPDPDGHRLHPSPTGLDWERLLREILDRRGVRSVAVRAAPRWALGLEPGHYDELEPAVQEYLDTFWERLGRDGLLPFPVDGAATLARSIEPTGAGPATIPLPQLARQG